MRFVDPPASPEALRERIERLHYVRLHCALILVACFGAGLVATKALLMLGVHTMWLRYAIALVVGYLVFLGGVRLWLRYAGFDVTPPRRDRGGYDVPDPLSGTWDAGASGRADVLRGGGGRSGGGGASARFDGGSAGSGRLPMAGSSRGSSGGGGGFDLDDGLVLLLLVAVALAVSGAVIYLVWAAPTILADAAFAALLSAGLVRSTRRMASGGWVASVLGNTWIAFSMVALLAIVFALVAQHVYPDARSIVDVVRHLKDA